MKKQLTIITIIASACLLLSGVISLDTQAKNPGKNNSSGKANQSNSNGDCVTIQQGAIYYSTGELIQTGYDDYGYNYQAHMFNGSYFNAYARGDGYPPYEGDDDAYLEENPNAQNHWAWPYRNVNLIMKWNDAWLANTDCDGDGLLDRHYGFDSYLGSSAWITNHMSGTEEDGTKWTYFTKIVAAPDGANIEGGIWKKDGVEIGPVIWSDFAVIQEIESGSGATYISSSGPGLGKF